MSTDSIGATMDRRGFLGMALGAGAVASVLLPRIACAAAAPVTMTVYKSPSCGCCGEWVKHVQAAGYTVKVVPMEDLSAVKRDAAVPDALQSCHTALVGAYVVEGHVPADLISRMLREKPKFAGLAVPGMPQGAPGMEQGQAKQAYNVIAFERSGRTSVYAKR